MQWYTHNWLVMCLERVNHFLWIKDSYISILIGTNDTFRMRNESNIKNSLLIGGKIGVDLIGDFVEYLLGLQIVVNKGIGVEVAYDKGWVWKTNGGWDELFVLLASGVLGMVKELTVGFDSQVWSGLLLMKRRNLVAFDGHFGSRCDQ